MARIVVAPLAVVAAWAYGMSHLHDHIMNALAVVR